MSDIEKAIQIIKRHRSQLTRQQMRTLCGQAKAGDTDAALKGLIKALAVNAST